MGMKQATYYINDNGEYIITYDGVDCAIIYQTQHRADRIIKVINDWFFMCKATESFKIVPIGQSGVRLENYINNKFITGCAIWFNNYD